MNNESPEDRKKRVRAEFENIGVGAVQIAVTDPATTTLFPGWGDSERRKGEAREWLADKARQRKWRRFWGWIALVAAVVGAVAKVAGLF